jgi:hypothetical protein
MLPSRPTTKARLANLQAGLAGTMQPEHPRLRFVALTWRQIIASGYGGGEKSGL